MASIAEFQQVLESERRKNQDFLENLSETRRKKHMEWDMYEEDVSVLIRKRQDEEM